MDWFKQSSIARRYNKFASRYRIFIDGLPFLMTLLVGGLMLTRFTKKRYVRDSLRVPTKEEMLEAGVDIDTDLASAKLEEELKKIKESLDTENWKNVPLDKK
ncbi:cytochrome c oxidase assembly protein COX16, mitochondrial-like [Pecten maximus]|uniref:cytochrome c oxidase assembly protein COX16, mitochondrial-like n=1 Tax=Pecten maximus TaxID=6579 RepID=UPI001458C744|nr:cytochrome c oxidase assembly protein COX16, mitochondrial-like [Pecten maximus]